MEHLFYLYKFNLHKSLFNNNLIKKINMKNKIKWLFIFIVAPLIIFAQDDSPPPFDETPPDYEPELNILCLLTATF